MPITNPNAAESEHITQKLMKFTGKVINVAKITQLPYNGELG